MTTPGVAHSLAKFYPRFASRITILDQAIRSVGRIHFCNRWVRDMPATVLRDPPPGEPERDVLWTGGYRVRHNRYVRREAFPAYHLSDGVTTVGAEVFGIEPQAAPVLGLPEVSRFQLLVDADVPEVLDLTDEDVREELGVSREELVVVPDMRALDTFGRPAAYELPQCIGELLFLSGAAGVLYPAARATAGTNVAIFTSHLDRVCGSLRAEDPVTGLERRLP